MKWSISAHYQFKRCQRQYFFSQIAASHNSSNPIRREAYLLKQLKTLQMWQGSLVHEGIKNYLLPFLEAGFRVDWTKIVEQTIQLARNQFSFSENHEFLQEGVSKANSNGHYCALAGHDSDKTISSQEIENVVGGIKKCFLNLRDQADLVAYLRGKSPMWAEHPVTCVYEGARVEVRPDLLFFRSYGLPTIVEWKVEESTTSSDHHLQTGLYAWVLSHSEKWKVTNLYAVEIIEVQLLQGLVVRKSCTPGLLAEVENFLYDSIHEIRALCGDHKYAEQYIEDYEYARSPNTCAYCKFNKLCKEFGNGKTLGQSIRDHKPEGSQLLLSIA